MRRLIVIISAVALLSACGSKEMPKVRLKTAEDTVSYYMGVHLASQYLMSGGIDTMLNKQAFAMGVNDVLTKKVKTDKYRALEVIQNYFQQKWMKMGNVNQKAADDFLAKNKTEQGVVTDSTGLQYIVFTQGTGPKPGPEDIVTVKYQGTLINGKVFDGNMKDSAKFGVNQVIRGWSIGLQMMPVGSHYKLFVPPQLAYGLRPPTEVIGPNSLLIFDVQLLDTKKPEAPKAPALKGLKKR